MKNKQIKRQEANARNMHWAALSINQKKAILAKRPGACKKQLNKLGAQS